MSTATDMTDDLWDDMRPQLFSEEWTAAELQREREEEANPPSAQEIAIEEGWDTGTTDAAWEAEREEAAHPTAEYVAWTKELQRPTDEDIQAEGDLPW